MSTLVQSLYDATTGILAKKLYEYTFNILEFLLGYVNDIAYMIFDNEVILVLFSFSKTIGSVILGVSIVFLIANIAENSDEIDYKQVFFAIGKGWLFLELYIDLGKLGFYLSTLVVSEFNANIDTTSITNMFFDIRAYAIFLIVMLISCLIFTMMSLSSVAIILNHIIAAPFIIPHIVQGDDQKLIDWCQFLASVSVSFFARYILFYFSLSLFLSTSKLLSIILLIMSFKFASQLKETGFSTGVRGALSKATQSVTTTARTISTIKQLM